MTDSTIRPHSSLPQATKSNLVDKQVWEQLKSSASGVDWSTFWDAVIAQNRENIEPTARMRAEGRKLPVESMLFLGVIGTLCFVETPITFLAAVAAGNLLCAWSPTADVLTERVGETSAFVFQALVEKNCPDWILCWVVAPYPIAYLLSWIPGFDSLHTLLSGGYSLAIGGFAGAYLWRQQMAAWQQRHHPNRQSPEGSELSLFRIREVMTWVEEKINHVGHPTNQDSAFHQFCHRYVPFSLTLFRGYNAFNRFWAWCEVGTYAAKIFVSVGSIGVVSITYHSPYVFATTLLASAYLGAASDLIESGWSENPILQRLDRIPFPGAVLTLVCGMTYLAAKGKNIVMATGVAWGAYDRGPWDFPTNQALALAYRQSGYGIPIFAGALVGQQLWNQARLLAHGRLSKERPTFPSALKEALVALSTLPSRTLETCMWLHRTSSDEIAKAIRAWKQKENTRQAPRRRRQIEISPEVRAELLAMLRESGELEHFAELFRV